MSQLPFPIKTKKTSLSLNLGKVSVSMRQRCLSQSQKLNKTNRWPHRLERSSAMSLQRGAWPGALLQEQREASRELSENPKPLSRSQYTRSIRADVKLGCEHRSLFLHFVKPWVSRVLRESKKGTKYVPRGFLSTLSHNFMGK